MNSSTLHEVRVYQQLKILTVHVYRLAPISDDVFSQLRYWFVNSGSIVAKADGLIVCLTGFRK